MTTGCETWELDMIAMLDGELDPERQAGLRAHLDACASCRELMAELERNDRDVASLAAPPGYWDTFNERLLARLVTTSAPAAAGRGRRWSASWLRIAAAIALVAGGVTAGWIAGHRTAQPSDSVAVRTTSDDDTSGGRATDATGAPVDDAPPVASVTAPATLDDLELQHVLGAVQALLIEVANTPADAPPDQWAALAVATAGSGLLDELPRIRTTRGLAPEARLRMTQIEQVLWQVVNTGESMATGDARARTDAESLQELIVSGGLVAAPDTQERAL